jgi:hypothetical protein
MDERPRDVSDVDIDKASTVVPLMATVPYLDLALNDYYLALDHPQHALIFLARAIESVENHFAKLAEGRESYWNSRRRTSHTSLGERTPVIDGTQHAMVGQNRFRKRSLPSAFNGRQRY